jgi:hypothetical protein
MGKTQVVTQNRDRGEGLKLLARIIAKAYLTNTQGKEVSKTQKRANKDEGIPRIR